MIALLELLAWFSLFAIVLWNIKLVFLRSRKTMITLAFLAVSIITGLAIHFEWMRDHVTLPVSAALPFAVYALIKKPWWGLKGLTSFGFLLNAIAIAANGGRMPGFGANANWIHTVIDAHTRMIWLTDMIRNPLIAGSYSASIGDILIYAGVIITAIHLLVHGYLEDKISSIKP